MRYFVSDKEVFNYLSSSFSDLSKYIIAALLFILFLVILITVVIIKVQNRKNNKLFNILKQQGIDFANQFKQQDINFKTKLNVKDNNYNNLLLRKDETYKKQLSKMEDEFKTYRRLVHENFRQVFSSGELILIDCFKELLKEPGYENWTIYGHLNMKGDSSHNYQADFLIVSDKGVYVIESKFWKGLTLIYTDDFPMIFTNTQFSDYGKGSDQGITVININQNSSTEKLEINKYTNPVAQARRYSKVLKNYFNIHIYNFVVFQQDKDCQVKINEKDLSNYQVGEFTSITTQNNFKNLLKNINSRFAGYEEINDIIKREFNYAIVLNSSNFNQPPWNN